MTESDDSLSSIGSPMDSSDASDDDRPEEDDDRLLRPTKRIKIGGGVASRASSAIAAEPDPDPEPDHEAEHEHEAEVEAEAAPPAPLDGMSDVSSDTSGDVPSSPGGNARLDEDDLQEQVTFCSWDGCDAGDLRNLDRLVEHIHNHHIENRQKKYTCEWSDCQRKGMPHASGYALKAHMRKHTREKPFYCYLPECDRAFTRSDALAKHMRTVHETEALRPSDPVPKSMQSTATPASTIAKSSGGTSKLKIIIKTPQSHASGADDATETERSGGDDGQLYGDDPMTALTAEHGFTDTELALPYPRLFRLCNRQLGLAAEETAQLQRDYKQWEDAYAEVWHEKEALLAQVIQSEATWHERRRAILTGAADVQVMPGRGVEVGMTSGLGSSTLSPIKREMDIDADADSFQLAGV